MIFTCMGHRGVEFPEDTRCSMESGSCSPTPRRCDNSVEDKCFCMYGKFPTVALIIPDENGEDHQNLPSGVSGSTENGEVILPGTGGSHIKRPLFSFSVANFLAPTLAQISGEINVFALRCR